MESAAAQESTTTPAQRPLKFWTLRQDALNEEARERAGAVDLLFVGDSITHFWTVSLMPKIGSGKVVWDQYYANRKAFNTGIAGDGAEHVLWRLEHGNIDGLSPKLAVVMIGTNNYEHMAQEIADGMVAVVNTLREKLPQTKVLLLAIFPRDEKPDETREKLAEASRLASRVADGTWVHYLDIGNAFLEKDGTLSADVMPDFLHPNEKGYRIWAEALEGKIKELMGEQ
jgi:lysophospholipase L1-like esterase